MSATATIADVLAGRARWAIVRGDARAIITQLVAVVHAVVTDPPYELGFMGKGWDKSGIANDVGLWKSVLAACLPGAHLLSFGGTRTYHRMACAIEDAGFEIRDQMQWLYGQGFPKSLDIAKAFDKANGVKPIGEKPPSLGMATGPNADQWNGLNRQLVMPPLTTAEAKQWEGWGTALKPANEPICLARKPLIGTMVENVRAHGVGGINIDAARVRYRDAADKVEARPGGATTSKPAGSIAEPDVGRGTTRREFQFQQREGRHPANVLLDEEAAALLDEQTGVLGGGPSEGGASRFFYTAKPSRAEKEAGLDHLPRCSAAVLTGRKEGSAGLVMAHVDGSAKANPYAGTSGAEPRANIHPTPKPIALMRYLCRLVTPPNGIVLDVFSGSGSTGVAALQEGFRFIGIDLDDDGNGQSLGYCDIARARLTHAAGAPAPNATTVERGAVDADVLDFD